jgi:hypothetical protein
VIPMPPAHLRWPVPRQRGQVSTFTRGCCTGQHALDQDCPIAFFAHPEGPPAGRGVRSVGRSRARATYHALNSAATPSRSCSAAATSRVAAAQPQRPRRCARLITGATRHAHVAPMVACGCTHGLVQAARPLRTRRSSGWGPANTPVATISEQRCALPADQIRNQAYRFELIKGKSWASKTCNLQKSSFRRA